MWMVDGWLPCDFSRQQACSRGHWQAFTTAIRDEVFRLHWVGGTTGCVGTVCARMGMFRHMPRILPCATYALCPASYTFVGLIPTFQHNGECAMMHTVLFV